MSKWITQQLNRCHVERKRATDPKEKERWTWAISCYLHMKHCQNRHHERQPSDALPDPRPMCMEQFERFDEEVAPVQE